MQRVYLADLQWISDLDMPNCLTCDSQRRPPEAVLSAFAAIETEIANAAVNSMHADNYGTVVEADGRSGGSRRLRPELAGSGIPRPPGF
jgi:hypothetical protein